MEGGCLRELVRWHEVGSGAPPASGDVAVIDIGGTYTVTVNSTATVAGLTVNAASGLATVVVAPGSLVVNGPGTFGAGSALRLNSGGVLGGTGDLTVERFNWSGGQVARWRARAS